MKKYIIFTIILLWGLKLLSQNVLADLENRSEKTLPNGLKIIVVSTKAFEYIHYRIVIDYYPGLVSNPAAVPLWAEYNGFEQNGNCQLYANRILDSNAIDTMFVFFRNQYFQPKIDNYRFNTAKNNLEKRVSAQDKNQIISKKFIFGKKSIYSINSEPVDIELLTQDDYKDLYKTVVIPDNISITVVGDVEADTVFKYAEAIFGDFEKVSLPIANYPARKQLPPTRVNFVEDTLNKVFSTGEGINFYYSDKDFWSEKVLSIILTDKAIAKISPYADSVTVKMPVLRYGSYVAISGKYHKDNLYDAVVQSVETIRDLAVFPVDTTTLSNAKNNVQKEFRSSLQNPYAIAEYAYIISQDELTDDYFTKAQAEINKISSKDIKECAKQLFFADNLSITLLGKSDDLLCQMYSLANQYAIYFYDTKMYKYKIIPKGFGCQYIFNNYLESCGINDKLKYLQLKYNITYYADTTYLGRAEEYYKNPEMFTYVSKIYLPSDTLLQIKQVYNKGKYYQKDALGEFWSKDIQEFAPLLWGRYLFVEAHYDKMGYEYEFVCDTNLIRKNIFKVKIVVNDSMFLYDYYNFDRKEKDRTEFIIKRKGKQDTVSTIFYTNYRKVSKNSQVKLPFTIQEHRRGLSIDMSLEKAIVNKKIKKNKFVIPKQKK